MKILICLLAITCATNASLLSLVSGKGGGNEGNNHINYNVLAAPNHGSRYSSNNYGQSFHHSHDQGHHESHGFGNSPQIIKVILHQGHSGSHAGGFSYGNGHSYGPSGYGQESEAQIFKVISQNSAGPLPVHIDNGYSAGAVHGSSYDSNYRHSDASNYYSEFNSILPQILQLILGDDGDYGGFISSDDLNSQLIAHFGRKGKAIITRSNGNSNSYYSGGHVVQKGHLQITRVEGPPAHGPSAHLYSPHGPPMHGSPSFNHGW